MKTTTFDHLKLARRDLSEVKRCCSYLLGMQRGEVVHPLAIAHEADNSCCRVELWHLTQGTLLDAMLPKETTALIVETQ